MQTSEGNNRYKKQEEVLARYEAGLCSPEERELVESWYAERALKEPFSEGLPEFSRLPDTFSPQKKYSYSWIRIAAAILLVSIGAYFITRTSESPEARKIAATEILPGYNQATLTLADGRTISLDSAQSGIVVSGEDIKYSNGEYIQDVSEDRGNGQQRAEGSAKYKDVVQDLQLSTPRGGQYQVTLPDGTKVWLNAQSTLMYPSRFTGDRREVELIGEAYFQVRKSENLRDGKKRPFIVKTRNQYTEVLGTEFNIYAYSDEKEIKTTLITGVIQVASEVKRNPNLSGKDASGFGLPASDYKILKPGQQSINSETGIRVKPVDINSELAWRYGLFNFNDKTLAEVMLQISRWYDIDVVYEGKVPDMEFFGEIRRNNDLSKVLEMLGKSGVKFRMEKERRLIMHE